MRISFVSAFCGAFALFCGLGAPPAALAAGPNGTQAGWAIDDSGNILITDAVADRLAQTGSGWVRLNFRLGPWTSDTAAFYSAYDTIVNRLRSRGLQIVGLMSNESWPGTQSDWCANNFENTGNNGYNNYIDAYGYAFARMASHWQGKIRYWEIWNEPNSYTDNPSPSVFTGGTFIYPSNFAAMLTHCHSQVHYYNNMDIQIISGGLLGHDISGYSSWNAGADYLDSTYYAGIYYTGMFAWAMSAYGSYPLDAVGQHIYINGGTGIDNGAFGTYLDYVHNVVVNYEGGDFKDTWVTEFGWRTDWVSEATQAWNLSNAFDDMTAKGYVKSALWFQLDDNPGGGLYYGVFRSDLSKKPSWNDLLTKTTFQGKTSSGATNTTITNYYNGHGSLSGLGSPFDNGGGPYVHFWDYGNVQDYSGGSAGSLIIFDTGYKVVNGFYSAYLTGTNHTHLRFPTNDEYSWGGGTRQDFQGGYMTWTPSGGVVVH